MRRLLIVGLALTSICAQAQTYRWVDSAGRVVISDTPPPGKVKSLAKTGEVAQPGDNLPFATKKAMEAYPVTLYTSADCPAECRQARDLLNTRGVPFKEKIVQTPEDIEELKQLIGDTFLPSLKVGGQKSRGFEAGAYNNLLDLAGYPKTAPFGSKPSGAQGK